MDCRHDTISGDISIMPPGEKLSPSSSQGVMGIGGDKVIEKRPARKGLFRGDDLNGRAPWNLIQARAGIAAR